MPLNWPVLKQGQPAPGPLSKEPIRSAQYLLAHHGHPNLEPDGVFGDITANAVRSFQESRDLVVDAIVGNRTWTALVVHVEKGDRGFAVRGVQSQFNARSLSGDETAGFGVDGIFGPKTDAAVRSFQNAAQLSVDGIVGPVTWHALVTGVLAG